MPSSYHFGTHYEAFIRDLVASGRYASASDVIREGLRLLEEREEQRQSKHAALREAIRQGVESGPGIPADDVLDRLESKFRG